MFERIRQLRAEFDAELKNISSRGDLQNLKTRYLGRKSPVSELVIALKSLSPEEKPQVGKELNELKVYLEDACNGAEQEFLAQELHSRICNESLDVTLPGRKKTGGGRHIVSRLLDEILAVFVEMGFSIEYGPDIESDYYNFESLNFPSDHPARDMQDTFQIDEKIILRTQTTAIQSRVMERSTPPIRVVAPGKAYRNETITARSHVFFHQVDGFYIDKNVTFADLIATLDAFLKKLLGKETAIRYRPSYFPFVEPGMEVDVGCTLCAQNGCPMCKWSGWLEILGAGMIHPEVLKNGGIDAEEFSGYAWGMGVERLASIRYGVDDIRLYTQNNVRFLKQFSSL